MKRSVFILLSLLLLNVNPMTAMTEGTTQNNPPVTNLKITLPNSNSVWTSPGKVKIEWDTKNIPEDKTIQFYLVKDDMVIQELGIFKNSKYMDNVALDRGLTEGNTYRVMGIELFPDNKKSIAKFATPFFTIKKAARKEIVKPVVVDNTITKEDQPVVRESFDGRNIKYIDELKVYSDTIEINLRDHGRVDGDIVSIYLNGVAVVSKHRLTYRNKTFEVPLDTSKPNDLFLYAHNLGSSPPNTVAIEIKDDVVSEKIILNSDLKSCEAILIKVGG